MTLLYDQQGQFYNKPMDRFYGKGQAQLTFFYLHFPDVLIPLFSRIVRQLKLKSVWLIILRCNADLI